MKRLTALVLILVFSFCLPLNAWSDYRKTKIAVLDFVLQGEGYETKDMGTIVAEWFITALVKDGRFDVIERGLMNKILGEQKLVMTGVVDESTATQLGKLLGVKVIISGTVLKLQNVLEINARIIDVESASIIAAENVKSTTAIRLQDLVVKMSEKIIKNFPLEGYIVNRKGKTVTVDLGQRAGVKTGMKFLVYKEGKVIKHPKTGEVLDVEKIHTGEVKITNTMGKISEGEIIKEKSKEAITYGQLVKSIIEKTEPLSKEPIIASQSATATGYYSAPPAASQPTAGARGMRPGWDPQSVMKKLKSPSPIQVREAAKIILRKYISDPQMLDAANEVLLAGYKVRPRDRNHVDAMSYLCKVLGNSGQPKYVSTLREVAKKSKSKKLRGYAKKSLAGR